MKLSDIFTPKAPIKEADTSADTLTGTSPVEIKDVVKFFPKNAEKAITELAKAGRLTFRGETVNPDSFIENAEADARRLVDASDEEVEVTIEDALEGEDFTFSTRVDEAQPVYVGYDPKRDALVVGMDVWLDGDEDFNESWDNFFYDVTGEEWDSDNPEHDKALASAWKKYIDGGKGFGGKVLVLGGSEGRVLPELLDEVPFLEGGFYRSSTIQAMLLDLISLRLD